MLKPLSAAKERLGLLRFEVDLPHRTLRQDGAPLAACLRDASARPWPDPDGCYYSYRTLETWWYDYTKRGYQDSPAPAPGSIPVKADPLMKPPASG